MNEEELKILRKSIHDLNNRVGVILATAELLQLEQLAGRALERSKLIEGKALEVRDILRSLSEQYFA
jgi:hypothetical protein